MPNVLFSQIFIWSVKKCLTIPPSHSITVNTSFSNVPELSTYHTYPSPKGVTQGTGLLNSCINYTPIASRLHLF